MKIQISHGADPRNWFIVLPMPHENAALNEAQVASLLNAGRSVYELSAGPFLGDQRATAALTRQAIADILAAAVTTDGAHHKQADLEEIAALLGIDLPDHEPGIPA